MFPLNRRLAAICRLLSNRASSRTAERQFCHQVGSSRHALPDSFSLISSNTLAFPFCALEYSREAILPSGLKTSSRSSRRDEIKIGRGVSKHQLSRSSGRDGINYYQEGNHVYPVLEVMKAYKKALTTWSGWVDRYLDSSKTQVVFRGYSLTHFRGGQWNSGGQCHKEIEPIYNETFIKKYPKKMIALEGVLRKMETPVLYLNVSRLTDYRKDGHPSIYRKKYNSEEELIAAEKIQDCSHWCLPGVPDTWNELLYASLLMEGKGSWGK